jgi:hypothetical protein
MRRLKNTKTGVIFAYNALLAQRPDIVEVAAQLPATAIPVGLPAVAATVTTKTMTAQEFNRLKKADVTALLEQYGLDDLGNYMKNKKQLRPFLLGD